MLIFQGVKNENSTDNIVGHGVSNDSCGKDCKVVIGLCRHASSSTTKGFDRIRPIIFHRNTWILFPFCYAALC